jgi:hypothetical protein
MSLQWRPTTGTATGKYLATGVSPRHESEFYRGHFGVKKSLFCNFFAKQATHFARAATRARHASDTFATYCARAHCASDAFATCCTRARGSGGGKFALNRAQFNSKIGSKILLLNLLLKSTAKPEN